MTYGGAAGAKRVESIAEIQEGGAEGRVEDGRAGERAMSRSARHVEQCVQQPQLQRPLRFPGIAQFGQGPLQGD
jgi:hypothetical protein